MSINYDKTMSFNNKGKEQRGKAEDHTIKNIKNNSKRNYICQKQRNEKESRQLTWRQNYDREGNTGEWLRS